MICKYCFNTLIVFIAGATELHRGYEKDSEETDCPRDITHIVFLVHGMGQLYHGDGGIINSRKKYDYINVWLLCWDYLIYAL